MFFLTKKKVNTDEIKSQNMLYQQLYIWRIKNIYVQISNQACWNEVKWLST